MSVPHDRRVPSRGLQEMWRRAHTQLARSRARHAHSHGSASPSNSASASSSSACGPFFFSRWRPCFRGSHCDAHLAPAEDVQRLRVHHRAPSRAHVEIVTPPHLADINVLPGLYAQLGVSVGPLFARDEIVRLR